jgi:hypothetical protein
MTYGDTGEIQARKKVTSSSKPDFQVKICRVD